jgi:hypothetical protein
MALSTCAARRKQLAIESILSTSAISNSWRRIWQTASAPLRTYFKATKRCSLVSYAS